MINKHKSNKIKENSNTVRHLNNGTDHRHSKSCCDQSSPARRTMMNWGASAFIMASMCSGNFRVYDVLIWNHFEFTMCSTTTSTKLNTHEPNIYMRELKWYTDKEQPNTLKLHHASNINTKDERAIGDCLLAKICWSVYKTETWISDSQSNLLHFELLIASLAQILTELL